MSDPGTEARLAALSARKRPTILREPNAFDPSAVTEARPQDKVPPDQVLPDRMAWERLPWDRVVATGASAISFAAMIVAMGPIVKTVEPTVAEVGSAGQATLAGASAASDSAMPEPPPVDIIVNPVAAQPLIVRAGTPANRLEPAAAVPTSPSTAPPATAPPATASPATAAPAAPEATTPPPTAPPDTPAPPAAPPPRSEGSGG